VKKNRFLALCGEEETTGTGRGEIRVKSREGNVNTLNF